MIKLIVSDMDGTLLDDSGKLDEDFFDILDRLLELDIIFAVASGRQYQQLVNNFKNHANHIAYIAENGSFVVVDGNELYTSILDKENLREIVEDIDKLSDINAVLCGKNAAYFNTRDETLLREAKKYYYDYKIVRDLGKVNDDIFKISIYDFKGPENNSYKALYPKWKDRFQLTISTPRWLDIYNKGTNKGEAVRLLQRKFRIKEEETMVFGDYYNDVDMFECAFYSYAMDNAPDDVKEKARFIAKRNSENGVIEVLKERIQDTYKKGV